MKPHIKYPIISVFLVLLVEAILLWLFLPSFLREPKAEPLLAPRAELHYAAVAFFLFFRKSY